MKIFQKMKRFITEPKQGIALDVGKRLTPLLLMFATIFVVFSITNYNQGSMNMAISDMVMAISVFMVNFAMRRKYMPTMVVIILLLALFAWALFSELIFPGAISSFLFYYGTIPFFVFYIAGKYTGVVYTIFVVALIWLVWGLSEFGIFTLQYTTVELLFFSPLLVFSAVCSWVFEVERDHNQHDSYQAGIRHESLLEAIGEVYYRVDNDGQIIEMSNALYKITGYRPSEVVRNPTVTFYAHPEERQGYIELLAMHGSVENYAITIVGKAGNYIRILMSSRLILDKNGSPKYIEGMFRDITKEQKVEEERKAHLEHLEKLSHIESLLVQNELKQGLQEAISELLGIFSAERVFLTPLRPLTEESCEGLSFVALSGEDKRFDLNGYLQNEEVRFYLSSIPKHSKRDKELFDDKSVFSAQLLSKYKIHSHVMVRLQTSVDDYWLLVLQNLEPSTLSYQQRSLFVDISRRIGAALSQFLLQNDLQAAVVVAEVASKAKGEFVATMSHELRTPLHGVIGLLDLMAGEADKLSSEQQQNLALAQASTQVLRSLIDDVLDLSKIESGKIEMQKQAFNLQQALSDALVPFVMKAREKSIGLNLEMRNVAEVIEGDVVRLRQVLLNLVGNAIKFTMKGYVRIVVSQDEEMLYINIEDSGIGIDKEKQAIVFSPFEQVHNEQVLGDNLQEKGTGLGTTIAQYFVKMMGGTLTLQSEPSVGSTMKISLPLQQVGVERVNVDLQMDDLIKVPKLTETQQIKVAHETAKRRAWSVLLAEDDPVGRRVVVKRLQRAGFTVETAADGNKAFELYEKGNYDLLLTDIRMPGLSGLQLTEKIRAKEKGNVQDAIVIVGLSAYAMEDVKVEALASGMDDFITKPVDMQVLIQTLEDKFSE